MKPTGLELQNELAEALNAAEFKVERLRNALHCVVQTWKDPGPMGTMYQMPRAIDEADRVLSENT